MSGGLIAGIDVFASGPDCLMMSVVMNEQQLFIGGG